MPLKQGSEYLKRNSKNAMWVKEDNTYNDIRRRSVEQWLQEIENNDDLVVRGGVKVTREYIEYLETEIDRLKEENQLKNGYLKKAAEKING